MDQKCLDRLFIEFFYSYEADSTFLQLEEERPYIEVTTVH